MDINLKRRPVPIIVATPAILVGTPPNSGGKTKASTGEDKTGRTIGVGALNASRESSSLRGRDFNGRNPKGKTKKRKLGTRDDEDSDGGDGDEVKGPRLNFTTSSVMDLNF